MNNNNRTVDLVLIRPNDKKAIYGTLPDSWLGYAQLSYETHPLPTEYLTSKEILAFRDYAFEAFFKDNDSYFNMIEKKFGQPAVDAINGMLEGKLKRKLLGN